MPKITFIAKDASPTTINAEADWSIMQVAVEHGIEGIQGVCGGAMACATCHVYIHPDWQDKLSATDNAQSPEEEDMLDMAFDVRPSSRLGCQIRLTPALDGLVVALPGVQGADWE